MRHEHRRSKPRSDPKLFPSADESGTGAVGNSRHAARRVGNGAAALPGAIQDRSGAQFFLLPGRLPPAPDRHLQPRPPHQREQTRILARGHQPLGDVARSISAAFRPLRLCDVAVGSRGEADAVAGHGIRSVRVSRIVVTPSGSEGPVWQGGAIVVASTNISVPLKPRVTWLSLGMTAFVGVLLLLSCAR